MEGNSLNRFFISIVLPSILAIGLFIVVIFVFILPAFEKNIMEGKKEMISELTNSVCSLIEEYEREASAGILSLDSARALAAERIERIRYGKEFKDYFWIIDEQPKMIMHPYRPDLTGKDLNDYKDPEGKLLFVESVELVREREEGFIDYRWQWKDDSTRIVPKLSYVKAFPRWNWVVGTGIYLEDVRLEINQLKGRLLSIVLIITLVICVILGFIIRQSLSIEKKRRNAEEALRLSREKYKSLVEASTEGTLMMVEGEFIFSNIKFSLLSGYDPSEIRSMDPYALFRLRKEDLESSFEDPEKSVSRESILLCSNGSTKEVVISVSRITYAGQTGYILIVKEPSLHMQFEKESQLLSAEMQTSLSWMNQPLKTFARPAHKCQADRNIREAAELMTRKQQSALLINLEDEIVGIINNNDLIRRAVTPNLDPDTRIIRIMSSPVFSLPSNALLYEGLLLMRKQGISHLAVTGMDQKIYGIVGYDEIARLQQNMVGYLIKEIELAENVDQLAHIYRRLPVLVKALTESGSTTMNLTRIISSLADAIHRRVVELASEEEGQAPCPFAFMVMGSLGRQEQTLTTDQDNAIILGKTREELSGEQQQYFNRLGKRINQYLHAVGYKLCEGEVMAGNPKWNHDLETWKGYFKEWILNSNPKDVLDAAIFFDFRFIYGEDQLVEELRNFVNETARNKSVFFYHMSRSVLSMKIPQSVEQDLDLKKLLLPVISYLRLYALRHQLSDTGSMERAARLLEMQEISHDTHEELMLAFNTLTQIRIRNQAEHISRSEIPGNTIQGAKLNQLEKLTIRKLLSIIAGIQTRLSGEYSGVE